MAKQTVYQFDIGGQARTLNFGMLAWDIFCEEMNISLGRSFECFAKIVTDEHGAAIIDEKGVPKYEESPIIGRASRVICYAGIVSQDRLNGVPDSVTMADIDAIYNDMPDAIASVATIAIKTRTEKILEKAKEMAESGKKKRSPSRTSKK